MLVRSFEEVVRLSLEADPEAVYYSHPVYALELRLYGGRPLCCIATTEMRWCQRKASLTCGHLRSSRKRSSHQANRTYAFPVQPSSRLLTFRYRLNRLAHIFEVGRHVSFHTMNISLSKPQIVCLQSKWDVLG